MTSRSRRWLSLLLLLLIVGTLVWLLLRATPGVTRENAMRLRRGMTVEQVQRLFDDDGVKVERGEFRPPSYCWQMDDGQKIQAGFDITGILVTAVIGYEDEMHHIDLAPWHKRVLRWFKFR